MNEKYSIEKEKEYREKAKKGLERKPEFRSLSNLTINPLYIPKDIEHLDYDVDMGKPGEYPFTRGAYPSMYRGRL